MKELFLYKIFKSKKLEKIEYFENLISKDFKIYFNYLHENEFELKLKYQIHLINVKYNNEKDVFIINITLSRPGLFIGKAGSNFDKIKNKCIPLIINTLIEKDCFSNVEINLIEFDPFDYLKSEQKIIANYENS